MRTDAMIAPARLAKRLGCVWRTAHEAVDCSQGCVVVRVALDGHDRHAEPSDTRGISTLDLTAADQFG